MSGTIFVSPGTHHSIGLEVFFKSLSCLSQSESERFTLVGNPKLVSEHLDKLNFNYELSRTSLSLHGNKVPFHRVEEDDSAKSPQASLDTILSKIGSEDILLTLPMAKEELFFKDKLCSGHTEYFRRYFEKESLTMFFQSHQDKHLLLTDHVSLKDVSSKLEETDIYEKIEETLSYLSGEVEEILFSGVNPHAGENGTLGNEEISLFGPVIEKLKKKHPKLIIQGPLPSDTIHQHRSFGKNQLFIYCYHDQSLNVFKERNRWLGCNITVGLPFKRISVDHGTAPDLTWKNKANYQGALFTMKACLSLLKNKGENP